MDAATMGYDEVMQLADGSQVVRAHATCWQRVRDGSALDITHDPATVSRWISWAAYENEVFGRF